MRRFDICHKKWLLIEGKVCEDKLAWRQHMRAKHQVTSKDNETVVNFMKIFSGLYYC